MRRAALVIALALAPAALGAQSPVRLGLAAGLTTGARGYGAGWHVQGSAGLALPVPRLGLRADLGYHSVPRRETWGGALPDRLAVPSAALGLTLALPRLGAASPYAVGGPGWYRDDLGGGAEWHFGWHAGAGAAWRLGRAALFAEARAHFIADGVFTRLIPLSLGVRF